ncbi:MAG: PPC domain-containing protein, partial [Verrucomicrobia bacterium]|nr:PPC domain-containing protein [Verrucomicrobiota bacterium]
VYPAGGRPGTTFEVNVAGQFIQNVTNVFVSGRGVEAAVVEFNRPLPNRDFFLLQDKMKELTERKQEFFRNRWNPSASKSSTNAVWTAADDREMERIRTQIRKNPPNFNNRISAALAEVATVRITLAPDAEPGEREIRLAVAQGVTNPLVFCVSKIQEFNETEEFKSFDPRFPFAGQQRFGQPAGPKQPDQRVTLPAVINGRLMPGDVDRFQFWASKGQRLVVIASARQLIPYISDAVPGWFQATLALYYAKGKEVAYDDDFRFNPDPVLFYQIPDDGDYTVEIKDSIFRGREDFVYRITVGELPFVTSIFPLGGPAGAETVVEKKGVNLRESAMTVDNRNRPPGIYRLPAMVANPVPFAVDALPECLEKEPNNDKAHAQRVTTPVIVNGRIGTAGDTDVFRIEGKEGKEFVAEVIARRLNSPLDSVLKLTDASGNEIAFNDDHTDKGAGLTTHHADSYIRATLPKTGAYYLHLSDTQQHGGAEYAYRLRLGPPQPDFELRVVPSSINTRVAATVPFTVYALRKDGFDGDIALSLRDAPEGFRLGGARLPAGQDKVRLTLTVPPTPRQEPLPLNLEGRATIAGRELVHRAVPAEDMMQAFEYRHLVPAKELKVFVAGNTPARPPYVRVLGEPPLKIPAGGTAKLQVFAPGFAYIPKAQLELSDPPEGVTIKRVTPTREGREIVLAADAKVKPGLKGNLIVSVSGEPNFPFGKGNTQPPQQQQRPRRFPFATLPAIPFEVVQQK